MKEDPSTRWKERILGKRCLDRAAKKMQGEQEDHDVCGYAMEPVEHDFGQNETRRIPRGHLSRLLGYP